MKEDYVEKLTLFGHIPWEYLGLPMNFSADLIYIWRVFVWINSNEGSTSTTGGVLVV